MLEQNESYKNEVAKNIKQLRLSKGWTQEFLAKKLHISTAACSKIENGYIDINASRLIELRDIFQISMKDLLMVTPRIPDAFKTLQSQIKDREREIVNLQKLLISLHEEIKNRTNIQVNASANNAA